MAIQPPLWVSSGFLWTQTDLPPHQRVLILNELDSWPVLCFIWQGAQNIISEFLLIFCMFCSFRCLYLLTVGCKNSSHYCYPNMILVPWEGGSDLSESNSGTPRSGQRGGFRGRWQDVSLWVRAGAVNRTHRTEKEPRSIIGKASLPETFPVCWSLCYLGNSHWVLLTKLTKKTLILYSF